jgi:ABC-2 type transport system permease protein
MGCNDASRVLLDAILYPLSIISNQTYQKILLLNPMAQAVQDARYSLVTKETITMSSAYGNWTVRVIPFALVIALLLAGLLYFRREAKTFAENL